MTLPSDAELARKTPQQIVKPRGKCSPTRSAKLQDLASFRFPPLQCGEA
jgi:hypothetical protein